VTLFRFKYFGLLLISTVLFGCKTTYTPESLKGQSVNELAFVQADTEKDHGIFIAFDERLYITNINGESTYRLMEDGHAESAYVKPGRNEIKVSYFHHNISSYGCVSFVAEPNQKYLIKKKRDNMKVYFWVVKGDLETQISISCKGDS
jgi:hypothetical protein